MITAYLKLDRQERFRVKRAWFVNAWRLVDESGVDLVQPWFDTKGEARKFAKAQNWTLIESRPS